MSSLITRTAGSRCFVFVHICAQPRSSCRVVSGRPNGVELDKLGPDAEFILAGKDVRVDHAIKRAEFMSGTCFSGSAVNTESDSTSTVLRSSGTATKQFVPLRPRNGNEFKTPSFVRSPAVSGGHTVASSSANQNRGHHSSMPSTQGKPSVALDGRTSYWYVNWRKPQQKKHKTWDGDAYLIHKGDKLTLVSEKGLV